MKQEDIATVVELANQAEALRPAVMKVKDAIKSYGPELSDLYDSVSDYMVDRKAESVKRLIEKHGFTKDEAMFLTVDVTTDIRQWIRQQSKNKQNRG